MDKALTLDPNDASNWDQAGYITGASRAGKDIAIYGVPSPRNYLKLIFSQDFPYPDGYTADDSKLLGGFHALPVAPICGSHTQVLQQIPGRPNA